MSILENIIGKSYYSISIANFLLSLRHMLAHNKVIVSYGHYSTCKVLLVLIPTLSSSAYRQNKYIFSY